MDLNVVISGCRENNPQSQKQLYEHYKSVLFAICRRYIADEQEAEDIFVEGFTKIFQKIKQYEGSGSFEGWMKKIMVNEALQHLRERKKMRFSEFNVVQLDSQDDFNIEADIEAREILELLTELPPGYRTIFNLFVVEGYKHHEIADLLQISINTSKSQLIFAKKKMAELIKKKFNVLKGNYGT